MTIAIILLFVFISMCVFWNIKLSGYSMPIQHRVERYTGKFSTTIGAVREITINYKANEKPVNIELTIYNSEGVIYWQKQYKDIILNGKCQILDYFEKENPLSIEKGTYRAECKVNDEIVPDIDCRFIEYSGSFYKVYVGLCVLILSGVFAVLIINYFKQLPLEIVYIVIMISMGFVYNYVMPPLGVPDEQSHFMEAYALSSKIMFQEVKDADGYLMIREDDYNSILYLHDMASISEWYDTFEKDGEKYLVSSEYISTVGTKAPHAYLASALGILIGRLLGCSGHALLILGRMSNLIVLTLLVALAIKIIPYGKYFYFILGALPEVIYLFTSYSYDGLNLVLCMLIVAYFLHLYLVVEKIGVKEMGIFAILLILMVPIKVVYIFLGLLVLLLPKDKMEISRKQIITVCIIGIIGIVAGIYLLFKLPVFGWILRDISTPIENVTPTDKVSMGYALQNIPYTIRVFLNTIFGKTNEYLNGSLGEIIGKGRYGGLEYYVVPSWMRVVLILLMLVGLEDTEKNGVPVWKRVCNIGVGIFIYIAVLLSMFFASTIITQSSIDGVQGRYFLPIYTLLPIIVKNKYFKINGEKRTLCILGIGTVNLLFAFLIFTHYATNYFV